VDWGFSNDETAVVRCSYDSDNGVVWVREVLYKKGLLIGQIADAIRADMEKAGCPGAIVYCDPARPEHIAELRRTFGIAAVPANNRDKAGRVDWLRGCDIHFVGENIEAERANYRYMTLPNDSTRYANVPQDGNDHLMDAINYGVVTHLRRQGIPNRLGEV
jgi:phage terminase large subunit